MRPDAPVPEWPVIESYGSRAEAVAAAMADMEPGDKLTIHQASCPRRWDDPCACEPEVIVITVARA